MADNVDNRTLSCTVLALVPLLLLGRRGLWLMARDTQADDTMATGVVQNESSGWAAYPTVWRCLALVFHSSKTSK